MTTIWAAPSVTEPVDFDVRVPGSKSLTNRYLVVAAMAQGESRLRRPLRSRDTALMCAGLRTLGVTVEDEGDEWLVRDDPAAAPEPVRDVHVGNAGTVARFLPVIAAMRDGQTRFDGDSRIRQRPISSLLRALADIGVQFSEETRNLPFTIWGDVAGAPGGRVTVEASASSQIVSALLLAGPSSRNGVHVDLAGSVPSLTHIEMTARVLERQGAQIERSPRDGWWDAASGPLRPVDVTVEPDLATAAFFVAAALVTGGEVRVHDWPKDSLQYEPELIEIVEAFGGVISRNGDSVLTVRGPDRLQGVDLDLSGCAELAPVVTTVAACAAGQSSITGIAHTRLHESDRIAVMATELNRCGAGVTELADGLVVQPRPLHGELIRTYDDHRIAMSAAVLGLVVPGTRVENVETAGKTVPDFAQWWQATVTGEHA